MTATKVRAAIDRDRADVPNFSGFSGRHSPEEAVETLSQYLNLQKRIIRNRHGIVNKFLEDGVMSVFPGADMGRDAIEAAPDVQRPFANFN